MVIQSTQQFPPSEAVIEEVSFLSESDDSDFEVVEEAFLWESLGSETSSRNSTSEQSAISFLDSVELPGPYLASPEKNSDEKPYTVNTDLHSNETEVHTSENFHVDKVISEENKPEEVKDPIVEEKTEVDLPDHEPKKDGAFDSTQARLTSADSHGLHASAFEENLRFTLENSAFDTITFELPLTLRIIFIGSGANGDDKEPILEKISHSLARLFEPSPTNSQTLSGSSTMLGSRREFGINYVVLPMSVLLGRDDLRNSVVRYEDSGVYIQVGDFIGRSASDTLQYIQSLESSFLPNSPHTRKNVVDVCFYFISPFPNNDDVSDMVLISQRVNVVPIIVGTEALNVDEIVECRKSILEMLEKNEVNIKSFTDSNILLTHGWLKNKGDICGETILTTTEFTLLDSQCVYNRVLEFHVDAIKSATKQVAFELKRKKRRSLRWFTTLMVAFSLILWILLPIPGLDIDIPDEPADNSAGERPEIVELLNQTTSISAKSLSPQPSNSNSISIISKPSTDLTVHTPPKLNSNLQKASTKVHKPSDPKTTTSVPILNTTDQTQSRELSKVEDRGLIEVKTPKELSVHSIGPTCQIPTKHLTISFDSQRSPEPSKINTPTETLQVPNVEECSDTPIQCILLKARRSISMPLKDSTSYILHIRSKVRSTAFSALGDLVELYTDFAQPHLNWYIEKAIHYRASIRQKISTVKVYLGKEYIKKVDQYAEPFVSKVVEMRKAFRERISNIKEKIMKKSHRS
ncbi:septin 2 [Basidiobolus ranarum]|uniref:Septin 2 n=1 Tax=Basidiobolus ranarum TaxID=34480 RepID=A0ABR2VP91_9FUNG